VWERPFSAFLPNALHLKPGISQNVIQPNSNFGPATVPNPPLTLLQLDSVSTAISQAVLGVLEELSLHYGCSIVSVNDLSQAELLARIWKPQVIICPHTLPLWVGQVSSTSLLAALPVFVLQTPEAETAVSLGVMTPISYFIQSSECSSAVAKQLYQRFIEAMAQASHYSSS
jgi:hypothetical protein